MPLLSRMLPLAPVVTALAVRTMMEPLVDDAPAPEVIVTGPPTDTLSRVEPASMWTRPPTPLFPSPTTTLMEPPAPCLLCPW